MPDGSSAIVAQRVCDVPIEHLHFIWPQVRGFVDAALARGAGGRYLPDDILTMLLAGKAKLWVSWNAERNAVEAAIVTQTIEYPRVRELFVWLVGSDNMKECFREVYGTMEAFARDRGCAVITGCTRRGWVRMAGPGWRETGATFEKWLDGRDEAP